MNELSAYDPERTLAVHCGNGFDAGFSPYQSARLDIDGSYDLSQNNSCASMRAF